MRKRHIIHFQGISTHRVQLDSGYLDDIASMVFTDEYGNEYVCMLHGGQSNMDDNRRFLLESAHEIADMQNRNELRQYAAEFASARPREFRIDDRIAPMGDNRSVLDDLADDDEDDVERYTAGDPDMEDSNLSF